VIVAIRPAARGPGNQPGPHLRVVCVSGPAAAATGHLFLIAAPFAMLALVCVLFIRGVPLRTTIQRVDEAVMDDEKVPVGVAR
jgi:hypothetical protein